MSNGIRETFSGLSKRDTAFLDRAIALAKMSDCRYKHGAIIVKGGRIVGTGINTYRNNPIHSYEPGTYSYHAEIAALRSVKSYRQVGKIDAENPSILIGSKLYVARVNRHGNTSLSRPCDDCTAELISVGIKEIIYTT